MSTSLYVHGCVCVCACACVRVCVCVCNVISRRKQKCILAALLQNVIVMKDSFLYNKGLNTVFTASSLVSPSHYYRGLVQLASHINIMNFGVIT